MSPPVTEGRVPWQVRIALPAAAVSAVMVLMGGLVALAYAGDLSDGPWPGLLLVLLAATEATGVVLLRRRRDWRLLAVASGVVAVLTLVWAGAGLSAEGMAVSPQTAFPLAPIAAAVLAASSGARCWTASRSSR